MCCERTISYNNKHFGDVEVKVIFCDLENFVMRLPLLSESTPFERDGGNFMYVECNDELSFSSSSPHASSLTLRTDSPHFDFEPFKSLLVIVEDKVKLLTDEVDHLRGEFVEKNETIKSLIDFINRIVVKPNGLDETDQYNNSVVEYNDKVTEHNLAKQSKNVTTRKRKRPNEPEETTVFEDAAKPSIEDTQYLQLQNEITFLRNEIINKNRIIEYFTYRNSIESTHRLIVDEDEDDDDNDLEEEGTAPLPIDDDSMMYDQTLEIMERLFIEDMAVNESTQHSDIETTSVSTLQSFNESRGENDELLEDVVITKETVCLDETAEPEEIETSYEDRINQRMDKIEKMLLKMNEDDDMLSVAPWGKHSNGFASSYMKKNGHQPGKGLGKTGEGIVEPISTEKKTLVATTSNSVTWPKGTTLIAGASMIQGLDETRMSRSGRVKVRSHGGATILDMRDHLNAILRKQPDHLIIHAHSNDASNQGTSADDMVDQLMDLKSFSEGKVPNIKVTFSCPIMRTDNALANAKQIQLKNRLVRSGLEVIMNDDIDKNDLGRKGLHLKPSGSRKLAINIINYLRNV